MSAPCNDGNSKGTIPVYCVVYRAPSRGGDVVVIRQKTRKEKLGTDVKAQLKASALSAQGCQNDAGMAFTALAVGDPNAGAVLRGMMAVTAFGLGGDA